MGWNESKEIIEVLEDIIRRAKKKSSDPGIQNELVWDIVSALRGPDKENSKIYSTGRIRAVLNLSEGEPHFIVHRNCLDPHQRQVRNRQLEEDGSHFTGHYYKAISALRKLYNYDLEYEQMFPTYNENGE